ncbi:hypothetical protein K450DRAFT_258367 [Umbelopsis ramanniana AG]|uniref:Uncharacterized protein n=1 Tax=Umbelopsis ramanniana AG TaxID=1314678 RepID=A0AAD5HBD6_UMBRA|nr:uncharacterized protein K450DRAFT_258367 [Umbelopsis ramanniana AG]KAI8576078.1 hypothetical protein K450DRAFT_258367 [Umbelopsis ramanniana AG]
MTSTPKSDPGIFNDVRGKDTLLTSSPKIQINSVENEFPYDSKRLSKVPEIHHSIGNIRKLSARRKLKKAIQSGTKALSVKTDTFYSTGMTGMMPAVMPVKRRQYNRVWHNRHRSVSSLSSKEKSAFAFKERTFVALQILPNGGNERLVFIRVGPSGQLLIIPYPMELTKESIKFDPVHSYFCDQGVDVGKLRTKYQRLQTVLKGIDKLGTSMWQAIGMVDDLSRQSSLSNNIQTRYQNRLYNFQLKNNEQKQELYNRVRFEMQLSERETALSQMPCQPTPIDFDTLITDLKGQVQAQQAALQKIEANISEHLKDISKYSNDLKEIDGGIPAIEESVDRAWRVTGTKTQLEQCHQQCILMVRQLRAVNTAMNRREEKLSRYRNWLKTMQVRVNVMTLSGRNSHIWQKRWTYISTMVAIFCIWLVYWLN